MVIVGARPNFVKIAPLFWEFKKHPGIKPVLVHTGQHYDYGMSQVFFNDLGVPSPDHNLGIGSDNHGAQTGQMLAKLEDLMIHKNPDAVVVVGDVNSTLAGALAAAKLNIPVAHIEAGLRSYDKTMPEEINRIAADHVSDFLFCPTKIAVKNLKKEGITKGVYNVGDIMLDVLKQKGKNLASKTLGKLKIKPKDYLLLTIHRAVNTDSEKNLKNIIGAILAIKENIIFPVHPRTKEKLESFGLVKSILGKTNIRIIPPAGYLEMLSLEYNAKKILTDSGGVQKEAFWLGIPCITLREETEWVETVAAGANILVGVDGEKIISSARRLIFPERVKNYYGNGRAAQKIVVKLLETFQ